jgi:hypothetical protein
MLRDEPLPEHIFDQYPELIAKKQWFDRRGKIRLSASRIKLYDECRFRFWKQYVLGERSPAHHSVIFGKAAHYAIEQFYKYGEAPKRAYLAKLDDLDEYREYPRYAIDGVQVFETNDLTQYRAIANGSERFFVERLSDHTYVLGFIDLIDERGWVIDFKTSQHKPVSINDDIQFAIYAMAYERLFGHRPKRVIWHHLRTSETVDADVNYLYDITLPRAQSIAETIARDRFESVRQCDVCKYYCPFRKKA